MIDVCMDGARVAVEKWRQFLLSPVGVYLYSMITGMGGIILLLVFFSMVLFPGGVLTLLPLIIAFNGASAGYGLMDKSAQDGSKIIALFAVGTSLFATGLVTALVLFPWETMLDTSHLVLNFGAALAGVYCGGWIAIKNTRYITNKHTQFSAA
ncbi:MAG: hypothetical protein CSB34_06595 [Desulfobulbus propionicus]|nr:MAG: hypothetical protein CSB34_06595 [Desulfobulbus propionicus]